MDAQGNGAEAAATEEQQPASSPSGEQEQEGSEAQPEGGEGGSDGGDDDGGGEEDQWATGGWLDEETGAGWGEEGGVQGGPDAEAKDAAPMEEVGSNATGEDKGTTAGGSVPSRGAGATGGGARGGRAGVAGHRISSSSGFGSGKDGGEGGRGGGRDGSRRGGLSVGSMRGAFGGRDGRDRDSGGGGRRGERGEGGRGGGRGGGYGSRGGGGPPSSSRQDYDRRYGPGRESERGGGGGQGGWEQQGPRHLPPPMTLPPPTHLGLVPPMPYDHRGVLPPAAAPGGGGAGYYPPPPGGGGGVGGDMRYNGQQPGMPPLPPGPYHPGAPHPGFNYPPGLPPPYGAPPPYHEQQQQPPQQQQQQPPHMYHQQALPHHPLHRGGGIALPPTSAAGMPPIPTFQKFMLEQTDEPSAEESMQRYAEFKFKYIEDYSKMVFEEKKEEEWFTDRYLPSARLEKSVQAKREWAKQEAGRFSRQLLQQPDLFVVSASLDPTTELEYHALIKRYAKSAASTSASDSPSPKTSGDRKEDEEGGNESSVVNRAAEGEDMTETAAAVAAVGGGVGEAGGSVVGGRENAKSLEGHAEATLFLRPFSSAVPRAPLEALLRERGGPFLRFLLSDPAKNTYCNTRSAWLVYASKEEAEAARQALHNTEAEHPMEEQVREGGGQQQPAPPDYFRPFTLQLFAHNGKKTVPVPAELSDPKHLEKDATQALALAFALDKEKGLDVEKQGLQAMLDAPAVKAELGRRNLSFQLDLVMAYMRRVHFMVFYGGDEFKDEGDLLFSAPQLYKRVEPYKPAEKAEQSSTEEGGEKAGPKWSDWTTRMDEKVARLLETLGKGSRFEGMDEAVQTQKELEEKAKDKWLLENMNNEDEGRWRCAAPGCTKLFKTSDFLQKHLLLKHNGGLEQSLRLVRLGLIRTAFEGDQEKPLPPVQVDKGSGVSKAVPVGEILVEVAAVLGKDMSRWRQLIEESTRRKARGREGGRGGGGGGIPRGRGGGHYGPRPVLGVGGGAGGALVAGGGGVGDAGVVGMDVGPPRVSKNYKDIDVPKSNLVTVDYGDVAVPPPPKRRKKRQAEKGGPATSEPAAIGAGAE